jgi:hypothetical protein
MPDRDVLGARPPGPAVLGRRVRVVEDMGEEGKQSMLREASARMTRG